VSAGSISLSRLSNCFQGLIPAGMATCSKDGEPNVTYLSYVEYVDPRHVALSCQFFNKTRQNVRENPYVSVELYDPTTFDAYSLRLRFDHAETEGPLFESMSMRIEAIASHTGMKGIFKLLSADVYEVLSIEPIEGFLLPPSPDDPPWEDAPESRHVLSELRGIQMLSDRINRAQSLEGLLDAVLATVRAQFDVEHLMLLLTDETGQRLYTVASRGYGESGVGAEVALGEGLIGTVAEQRRPLRVAGLPYELRYGRAIRDSFQELRGEQMPRPEIPLPGLPDVQAQLAFPLVVQDRLVGVLALESRDPVHFDLWHEAFLTVLGNQIAFGIATLSAREDREEPTDPAPPPAPVPCPEPAVGTRTFCLYKNDDCVFVDGEYLIRNVPGKILWKILSEHRATGRREFSNRELRLDPSLGLPPIKDNLESRLILLRRRLEQKCPGVRLVPTRRGRFALELCGPIELVEKTSA
jgi:hypothetical protein